MSLGRKVGLQMSLRCWGISCYIPGMGQITKDFSSLGTWAETGLMRFSRPRPGRPCMKIRNLRADLTGRIAKNNEGEPRRDPSSVWLQTVVVVVGFVLAVRGCKGPCLRLEGSRRSQTPGGRVGLPRKRALC